MKVEEIYYSLAQAAEYVGLSRQGFYNLRKSNRYDDFPIVQGFRGGPQWIEKKDLHKWCEKHNIPVKSED